MTKELIDRLRDHERSELGICMEAANEIENLRESIQHAISELEALEDQTAQIQCAELAAVLKA